MPRLSKSDWLDHGLTTLARSGYQGLRAEPMSKALGVSRGSFYWHFDDISAFHQGVLALWRARTTDDVILDIDAEATPKAQLMELIRRATRGGGHARLERAVRQWAQVNKTASRQLAAVDKARLDYLAKIITAQSGADADEASLRARLIYAASIGDPLLSKAVAPTYTPDDIARLAELLLAPA